MKDVYVWGGGGVYVVNISYNNLHIYSQEYNAGMAVTTKNDKANLAVFSVVKGLKKSRSK